MGRCNICGLRRVDDLAVGFYRNPMNELGNRIETLMIDALRPKLKKRIKGD
jgi:hypothetical protein